MVTQPTLRELLEAGAHFGHKTSRWDPRMKKYIFTSKNGVHVINLEKTQSQLAEACDFLAKMSAAGKNIVFVGTKKQAQEIVKKAAENCDCSSITERWLGGTLTNFNVILRGVKNLERMEMKANGPEFEELRKRDKVKLQKAIEKSQRLVGGLLELKAKPEVMILIGSHDEKIALKEAIKTGITTIALVDTNTNPDVIDFPIPANDDATKSISLFANLFAKVIKEGRSAAKAAMSNS